MSESKWHANTDPQLRPEPALYRLETTLDGQKWSLRVITDVHRGSPRRKTLLLPRHDAEAVRGILESHYGEGWTLVREGDR